MAQKKIKGWVLALIIAAGVIVLGSMAGCSKYNGMVQMQEEVDKAWSQVQNQYQRRYDLVPNLVSTVKGYAAHESDLLTQVTEARSKAGGVINVGPEVLEDPEAFARFQQIQDQLGSSLQRLMAVTEAYPDLKANENFLALQNELEGTENRIATERKRFNDAVAEYNKYIRVFPNNLIANMGGFEKNTYFSAGLESQSAPKVEF